MRNPFSTSVASARIPDGSASLSSSSRVSHSKRVNCTGTTVCIALYPGFTNHVFIQGAGVGPANVPNNLADNALSPDLGLTSRYLTIAGSQGAREYITNVNAPSKFRIVSQGLRISLIENSENNDGWFEAIRIPAAYDASDFVVIPTATATNLTVSPRNTGLIFGGNLGLAEEVDTHKEWSMNPTYITGKLRDINRHTFMLHRENDYDFVDLGNENTMVTVDQNSAGYGTAYWERSAGSKVWWCDPNMDTVLIRCHSSSSGTSAGQNLHIHSVQHVEELFEPDSELARYMTKPPVNTAMTTSVMNLIRRGIKPSIVRAPTGGVSVRFSRTPRTYRRKTVRKTRKRSVSRKRVIKRRRR